MTEGTKEKSNGSPACHRIVAKFGTSLLTGGTGRLDEKAMSGFADQIARLHHEGREIVMVTSGAVAAGRSKLGVGREWRGTAFKQVLASIGQSSLMNAYEQIYAKYDITVAQALLTKADLASRPGYLNARNTLLTLMELRVLCIVNENDVVAVDELQERKFGDNDNLSAMVANLVDADLLLILSDTIGLCTADPQHDPTACLIPEVKKIDASIERLAVGSSSKLGTGGMITKITAAKLATSCGIPTIIASGKEPDIMLRIIAGESIGTRFLPTRSKLDSRRRWMLSGLRTRGRLVVDVGAAKALVGDNRSLLAAGIVGAEGSFERGDIINIFGPDGVRLGAGITNYSAADVTVIKGKHSGEFVELLGYDYGSEVVHRNNLVIASPGG